MQEVSHDVVDQGGVGEGPVAAVVAEDEDGPHHGALEIPVDRQVEVDEEGGGGEGLHGQDGDVQHGDEGQVLQDVVEGGGEGRAEAVGG